MPTRCWMAPEIPTAMYIFGRDGLAGAAHLALHGQPAVVADGPGCGQLGAQCLRRASSTMRDVLGLFDAAADRDDDLGGVQVHGVRAIRGKVRAVWCGSATASRLGVNISTVRGCRLRRVVGAEGSGLNGGEVRRIAREADIGVDLALEKLPDTARVRRFRRDEPITSLTSTRPSAVASLGAKSRTW